MAAGGNTDEVARRLNQRIEDLEAYLDRLRNPAPDGNTTGGVSSVQVQWVSTCIRNRGVRS